MRPGHRRGCLCWRHDDCRGAGRPPVRALERRRPVRAGGPRRPSIELVCDPLQPAESSLRGVAGWREWVERWEQRYEHVHIDVDVLVPMDCEHVLALVTINATPTGAGKRLNWAAAHVWTVREGRITCWETHLDIAAARRTLEA
jgi:hypothetical protein